MVGSGIWGLLVFVLALLKAARLEVFLGILAVLVYLAFKSKPQIPVSRTAGRYGRPLVVACALTAMFVFTVLYLNRGLGPETSPDGSGYHLGAVLDYWTSHSYIPARDFYGAFPQLSEMLFLPAFAVGGHTAAALTHFVFLLVLPFLILEYCAERGMPNVGWSAALLVFASPIVALDGTSAYNDVALAALCFAAFYVLERWLVCGGMSLLAVAGWLAGTAVAMKYTGGGIIAYALLLLSYETVRAKRWNLTAWIAFLLPAGSAVAPWVLKNWILFGNPLAPFANRWFPNPYLSPLFEEDYRHAMAHFSGTDNLLEMAVRFVLTGREVGGFLGPVFFLIPLGLLALRSSAGRRLLLAALFLVTPVALNTGTRFFIPALPFLAIAMSLVLSFAPWLLAVVVAIHAVSSWPSIAADYRITSWSFVRPHWKDLSTQKGRDDFAAWRLGPYWSMAKAIEAKVPRDARIFARAMPALAHMPHRPVGDYQTTEGRTMLDILWTPLEPERQARKRVRMDLAPLEADQVRLELREQSEQPWRVAEIRLLAAGATLPLRGFHAVAEPNPWQIGFALDGNAITKWSVEQRNAVHPYIQLQAPQKIRFDAIEIDMPPTSPTDIAPLVGNGNGGYRQVPVRTTIQSIEPPQEMRRMATAALKARGFSYFVVDDSDFHAGDFKQNPGAWGMSIVASTQGWTLYHLD